MTTAVILLSVPVGFYFYDPKKAINRDQVTPQVKDVVLLYWCWKQMYFILFQVVEKQLRIPTYYCTVWLIKLNVEVFCIQLGPVVQNIVGLTSSLRGQLVKCFTSL